MNKLKRFCALVGSLMIAYGAASVSAHAKERVVIGYNDYPPYTWTHDGGGGIVVDLVRAAFARVGVEVVLRVCDWEQCERELDQGRAFAAIPYRANSTRRLHYDFSGPLVNSVNRFFYLPSDTSSPLQWQALQDFRPYRMGGSRGHWYVPAFEQAGLQILFADGERANFQHLLQGQINFFLTDELVGRQVLQQEFPAAEAARVAVLPRAESAAPLHLMISRAWRSHARLRQRFEHGLQLMVGDGMYASILRQHGLGQDFATQPQQALASAPSTRAVTYRSRAQALYEHGDAGRNLPACASCHGAAGVSAGPHAPSLAAQQEAYLAKQLRDFQLGQRGNAVMAPLARLLDAGEIGGLSAWLAAQPAPAARAADEVVTQALGRQVYLNGIPGKNIPACASCHGIDGSGRPGPRLAGQSPQYQAAQLLAFRDGRRSNGPLMLDVARRLSDDEIMALSVYMASMGRR